MEADFTIESPDDLRIRVRTAAETLLRGLPRLRVLSAVKRRAEENMSDRPTFVYVTYIASTPEKVWEALTDADLMD